jgi:hypothetical protein
MSTPHTTPQPSHQSNSCPCPTTRTLFPLKFPNQLAMIRSQMTLSCHLLTKKQLAQEMWTCKDPLCRTPHHQIPTGYCSIPSTSAPQGMKSCHQESSAHGSAMTQTPCHCMGVSPRQQGTPDLSPRHHLTVPRFIVRSLPKGSTLSLHIRPLRKLPAKGPQKSCHHLAEDAAHALLSGASCRSHPYSLKYRSPAQSPPREP